MKFFIYLCCIDFLLNEISARSRRTTPMSPELHSHEEEKGLVQKHDEMIEFINDYYNNSGRKSTRSGAYRRLRVKHPNARRIELPASMVKNLPASVLPTADDVKETQVMKLAETVRYQLIDNPEVLEKFINKLKKKGDDKFKPVLVDTQSAAARSFSTVDKKGQYYHRKAETYNSTDTLNLVLTLPTNKSKPKNDDLALTTYLLSFDEDGDDISVKFIENDNSKPRTDDQNHVVPEKKYKTYEFGKKTGIKVKGNENKAYVGKNKALSADFSNIGIDHEENKETVDSKNVRTRADSANSKVNKSDKKENGNKSDNNLPNQRSRNKKKRKHKSSKKLTTKEHKKKSNRKHKEKEQSTNPNEDKKENSYRFHKKSREESKIDNTDIEFKRYKKQNHTESSQKDREVNVIDNQKDYKENVQDTMEIEWNKRHSEKNDNSENIENKYNFEEEWKEDYDFIKRDSIFDERDKKWIIRDKNWNKNGRIYVDEVMNQKFWDEKLDEQQNTGSDMEKQDRWFLRNERDKIIENSNYNKREIQL